MKHPERDENGKYIIYESNGVKYYYSFNGDKIPVGDKYELTSNGKEIFERLGLSQKHKYPDYYKGIYYSSRNDGTLKRIYIDEAMDGLSFTSFNGLSSERVFIETIVYDKFTKTLQGYSKKEIINDNQEIRRENWGGSFYIDVSKEKRLGDKRILDLSIKAFFELFEK